MPRSMPCILAVLAVMILVPLAMADDHPQKPGKWKITVEVSVPNMPVKIPPTSFEHCVTEEDIKDPQKSVPNDPKNPCKVGDYKVEGNKVTWTVDCPKQKTTGTGQITFSDEGYTGWMKMKMGEQEMSTKYTGKYLGTCEK